MILTNMAATCVTWHQSRIVGAIQPALFFFVGLTGTTSQGRSCALRMGVRSLSHGDAGQRLPAPYRIPYRGGPRAALLRASLGTTFVR